MRIIKLLLLLLVTIGVPEAFADPQVDAGQAPCKELMMLAGSESMPAPIILSKYYIYSCGAGDAQRFVLRRDGNRDHRGTGELVVPAKLLKPHVKAATEDGQPIYYFNIVSCVTHMTKTGDGGEYPSFGDSHIWALYSNENQQMPMMKRVFFAWRGETQSMTLTPIPLSELLLCNDEIENED